MQKHAGGVLGIACGHILGFMFYHVQYWLVKESPTNNNPFFAKNLKPFKRHQRPYTEVEFRKSYCDDNMTITEMAIFYKIGRKKIQNDMRFFGVVARKSISRAGQRGENNNNWKGDNATYEAYHRRMRQCQPQKCEICGTTDPEKHYEWASMSKKYHDPDDYKRLCRSCHSKYDKMEKNFVCKQ